MAGFHSYWQSIVAHTQQRFFSNLIGDENKLRKASLMCGITITGICFLVLLGIVALLQGGFILASLDFSAALLLIVILFLLQKKGRLDFCITAGILVIFILYIYLFFSGGVDGNAFLWSYTLPLLSFFLLGSRKGFIISLTYFLLCFIILLADINLSFNNLYDKNFAFRFIPSFWLVIFFSYIYEKFRERYEEELIKEKFNLEKKVSERTEDLLLEIKEKDKAKASAIKAKNEWERTFNTVTDGIFILDETYQIVRTNKSMAELLNMPIDKLINRKCYDIFHGSNEPPSFCPHSKLLKDQQSHSVEYFEDRMQCHLASTVSPLHDESGVLLGSVNVVRDITGSKQAEMELQKSETQLRTVIETIPDLIWLKDPDGAYLTCNHKFERFFGAKRDDIIGKTDYDFVDKELADFFRENDKLAMAAGKPSMNEEEITYSDDGHKELLETIKTPMFDHNGKLVGVLGVGRDITKRKEMEEELFHAHKMEAIGTMAGGIAHDFNNILAAILGYAELIKSDVSEESEVGKDIREIITSGRRAADLVKQLLAYSKKTGLEKRNIYPHSIIREALKMLRATLPTSIAIEEDIDPHCGTIFINPTNLHQIIINLCTNASQSIPEMKGVIRIVLEQRELGDEEIPSDHNVSAGEFIVITVSDSGYGMNKETMSRIFEPYFTTKGTGTRLGAGLGLAVVHGIVHDYNGFIKVDSTIGKGTSFHVYFPVSEEPAMELSLSGTESPLSKFGNNERVLVVDDDPLLIEIYRRTLTNNGYHVTCFTDSLKALDTFNKMSDIFDMVITDQTMPGLTGADLAKAVLEVKPSMPIIMCTGHSETVPEEKALSLGIKKYIFKPVSGAEILEAVHELLSKSNS